MIHTFVAGLLAVPTIIIVYNILDIAYSYYFNPETKNHYEDIPGSTKVLLWTVLMFSCWFVWFWSK